MPDDENDQEKADDQSTTEAAESDQQPVGSEQSEESEATDQSTEQSEEQPADETEQPEQESADQSTSESDQFAEQSEEPTAESDQPADESTQVADLGAEQADTDDTGTGTATEDFASDTVASAGGTGATKVSGRTLKVIAEFTEEGNKFIGDILIHVFESDNGQQGRLLFQTGGQFWQDTVKKGNVITTPMLRVATSEVLIFAHARVLLSNGDFQTMDSQDFKIPLPSGDALRVKFDVGVGEIENTVNAPDADAAKAKVFQSPQLKGHLVKGDLKAEPIGNQQFRVTGKFLSGDISLL
jgi:hypothetical protein